MKILLAEDNQPLRETVEALLTETGHIVDTAENGILGLEKALKWDYDVLVIDIMMPELNGLDMLKKLRLSKSTPAIMLTAKESVADKVEGLQAGADDYMTKPFDILELCARIESVHRRSNHGQNTILESDGIKIDTLKRSVSLNGKTQTCTTKEYALIELFVSNTGKILSRSEIYQLIFEDEDETTSNVLEVYIYKLRKKFGKNRIRTKRGSGYTFG